MKDDRFGDLRDALNAFKEGKITEDDIREQFGTEDGVERSIAAARAKQTQTMADKEVDEFVSVDVDVDV